MKLYCHRQDIVEPHIESISYFELWVKYSILKQIDCSDCLVSLPQLDIFEYQMDTYLIKTICVKTYNVLKEYVYINIRNVPC